MMEPLTIAALIGAGASLLGGVASGLGSVFGAADSNRTAKAINEKNAALQKEFAQNSIQWKIEDAKKAGIHPLYALGAQGYSASPSYVGFDSGAGIRDSMSALGAGIQNAGRSVLDSYWQKQQMDLKQKEIEYSKKLMDLDIMEKRAKINLLNRQLNSSSDVLSSTLPNGTAVVSSVNAVNQSKNATRGDLAPDYRNDLAVNANDLFAKAKQPYTMTHVGQGVMRISFDPESIQGQSMSEDTFGKALSYYDLGRFLESNNYEFLHKIEKEARAKGILTKKKPYFAVEWHPYGWDLVPSATRDFRRYVGEEYGNGALDRKFKKFFEPAIKRFDNWVKKR